MKIKICKGIVLSALALMFTASTHASILFSSNLDGNTVTGTQMTDITWYQDGVMGLGDLTVEEINAIAPALALHDTTDSSNRFAVDRNIHNEGSWFVDFAFSVDASLAYIAANSFTFDALIFNNSGSIQSVQRLLNMSVELFDGDMNVIASEDFLQIFGNSESSYGAPEREVSFSLSGTNLMGGEDYTFRITAFGLNEGRGNNAGLDNIAFEGTKVPEPAVIGLFGLALLTMRKFRKS
ncbi:hypothetical protein [Alteromonas antoniana]|uniref:hypothetical protein n=1 Tax=Alteromonas antoniana TaxID=2803813 RepID=UPI001C48B298|nr:hypothetical protein [Alteromonas antoniana]